MRGGEMDAEGLVAVLEGLKKTVSTAVVPAANAMASGFQDRVVNVTLRQSAHAPGVFYHAVPGRAPAYASGALARSIVMRPASGAVNVSAWVGTGLRYAAIQEFGGWTVPNSHRFMHWTNSRGPWWKKRVTIPEHPYFRPTVTQMSYDGSLTRLAASAFYRQVSRYFYG